MFWSVQGIKLKKRTKCSHLLTVRAKVADPPSPPCGQPDRKISGFFLRLALRNMVKNALLCYCEDRNSIKAGKEWGIEAERERGGRVECVLTGAGYFTTHTSPQC